MEDYLAAERRAIEKSEYFDGSVYAMSGASFEHNAIVANLITALKTRLRRGSCRVYPSDLRVATPNRRRYFYPDVTVVCGQAQSADEVADTLLNPTLLFEVLSDSTAAYDRGRKFLAYQTIPSLQEYVLVAQDEPRLECYRRQADGWLYTQVAVLDGGLRLQSLELELPLAEVYEDVL